MATKVQIIFEIANVSPIIFSQKHRPDEKKRKPLTSVSLFSSLGNWHPYPGACPHDYSVLRNSHIHDLSGVAEEQLEALVDAGSLEVVALGVASGLRAEVLLRKDAVEYCQ